MRKPDLLHNILWAAFFLCLGGATVEVISGIAKEPTNPCRIADQYRASLEHEVRECRTEMCVLYFQDRASIAEEECALETTDMTVKPIELPVTEKY